MGVVCGYHIRYNVNLGSNKKCYYEVYTQRAGAALTTNYQFRRLIVPAIFMNNKTIEMLRDGTLEPAGPSLRVIRRKIFVCQNHKY